MDIFGKFLSEKLISKMGLMFILMVRFFFLKFTITNIMKIKKKDISDEIVVNHKRNFINPLNGANTQKIERFWRDLKKSQKIYHGISRDEVDSHVAEAVWRKNRNITLENSFVEAIELIR